MRSLADPPTGAVELGEHHRPGVAAEVLGKNLLENGVELGGKNAHDLPHTRTAGFEDHLAP